jgi:ubiquitin C-terminal hydrolase
MDVLTDKFAGYEQRDAHEFIADLIDFLHDELANAQEAKGEQLKLELPTDKYFRLDVDVCLTCNSCKYSRSKVELYRHLSVEVGTHQEGVEEGMIHKNSLVLLITLGLPAIPVIIPLMRSGRKIMETGGSGSTLMHLQDFN